MNLSTDKLGWSNFLVVLKRRKMLILAVMAILVVVVLIGSFAATPLYRAQARIIIEREPPKVMPFQEVYELETSQKDYYQTQYKILQSRDLASNVLKVLKDKKIIKPGQNLGRMELLRMIAIEPIKSSWLVDIFASGPDPELVAALANTWAEEYIRDSVQTKLDAAANALNQLRTQLKEQALKLKAAREELQRYKEDQSITSMEEKQSIEVQTLSDLNRLFTDTQKRKLDAETKIKQLDEHLAQGNSPEVFPLILQNGLIQNLKSQRISLQSKYSDLSKRYRDKHPVMLQLKAEMDSLDGSIQAEIEKIFQGLRADWELAKAEEKRIAEDLEGKKLVKLSLDRRNIDYMALKENMESDQKIYEALLARLNETNFYKNLELTNIRILERANVPSGPFRPRKVFNFGLSLIGGLILGIGVALVAEQLDDTIKTPDEIKNYLNLPVLGAIPLFDQPDFPEDGIIIYSHPHNPLTESFRAIRTAVSIHAPKDAARSILVTSSSSTEGKSLVSLQLAAVMAQVNEKVLLIDSDLRKPSLHKVLGLPVGKGLREYLAGEAELSEVVLKTEYPNVFFLQAGKPPSNASELLSSERLKRLMHEGGTEWDRVIFDSPPLVSVTDGAILAAEADAVIFVIRAYKTPWAVARQGSEILSEVKAKLLGALLNGVVRSSEYYYRSYSTYGGYGGYGT